MTVGPWGLAVVVAVVSGCPRGSDTALHPADATRLPQGRGWFESAVESNVCTRTCETRPGAMTAQGTAPVADCRAVATAWCFTYDGPSNAGGPSRCFCDQEPCVNFRQSMLRSDFGAPLRNVSDCVPTH